jgi:hypothetical protein
MELTEQTLYSFECPCCGFPQQVNQNNPFFTCVSCGSFYGVQCLNNTTLIFHVCEVSTVYHDDQWQDDYINEPIEPSEPTK